MLKFFALLSLTTVIVLGQGRFEYSVFPSLKYKTCPKSIRRHPDCKLDVLFVIDATGSVVGDYANHLAYASKVIQSMDIADDRQRVREPRVLLLYFRNQKQCMYRFLMFYYFFKYF